MPFSISCLRWLTTAGVAGLVWLVCAAPVWAQAAEPAEAEGKNWVLAYGLVTLFIGLAISIICRPGKRTAEVKPLDE